MEQTCPNCDRYCPASALHCGRGREYFGVAEPEGDNTHDHEKYVHEHEYRHGRRDEGLYVVKLLRECGHVLHHGRATGEELIAPLTAREIQALEHLLEKCLYKGRE